MKPSTKCSAKKLPANADKQWEKAFCPAMDKVLQPELNNGFSPYVLTKLFNERAGERNLAGIIYRRTQKDRPMLLNFCPFCGVKLESWLRPHLKKEKRA